MRGTYMMLVAVWVMMICCLTIAWQARRQSKKLDRWIAEHYKPTQTPGA